MNADISKIIFYLLLTNTYLLNASDNLVITIPKSGSHLIQKCLNLINEEFKIDSKPINFFHLRYSEQSLKYFKSRNYNFIYHFLMTRDPRDQIVSFIYYFPKLIPVDTKIEFNNYRNLSFDEILLCLICFGSSWYQYFFTDEWDPTKKEGCNDIFNFYKSYLDWQNDPNYNFCLIKFENLVGPKGGGSLDLQYEEISKIFKHLKLTPKQEDIKKIADNLFGETATFREGQIGSWKKHFKEIHKHCFKKIAGQLLIDLGYEKDMNW